LALVKRAAGSDAGLEASDEDTRFDILPLLVATDGAVAAFGRDVRRLRPNILIGGIEGMRERDWQEAELHVAGAIRLDSLRGRMPEDLIDPRHARPRSEDADRTPLRRQAGGQRRGVARRTAGRLRSCDTAPTRQDR
jgi:hypothetical protein